MISTLTPCSSALSLIIPRPRASSNTGFKKKKSLSLSLTHSNNYHGQPLCCTKFYSLSYSHFSFVTCSNARAHMVEGCQNSSSNTVLQTCITNGMPVMRACFADAYIDLQWGFTNSLPICFHENKVVIHLNVAIRL